MYAILLLSVLVTGQQCGPKGCFPPTYSAPIFVPQVPSIMPVLPNMHMPQVVPSDNLDRPHRVIKTYSVTDKGLEFDVRGYWNPDRGKIVWEPSDPFNRRSYAEAVARRNAARIEPTPVVVRPVPAVPANLTGAVADPFPGGVAPEKLHRQTKYTAQTAEARRFVAEAVAEDKGVGKLHVTVIGSDADRAPVVNDLDRHPALAALKPDLMVQDYEPTEWPIDSKLGFASNGKPSIIVQAAKGPHDPKGGRVVYRALDYSGGPEALAQAIRKADPAYNPALDPGPATGVSGGTCPFGFTTEHRPLVAAAVVGLAFLLKLPRKGS